LYALTAVLFFTGRAAAQDAPEIVPPRLLSDATVSYPEGASGDATVVLTLTLNADGTVRSAVPAEDNEPFSSAAAGRAAGWKFQPATRGGKSIAARIRMEVAFVEPRPVPVSLPEEDPGPEGTPIPTRPETDDVRDVVVRGARGEPSRTVSLSRAEVRQLPGAFGDPFRAVEVMPGVTPIVSGLPYFYVRGAPPGDVGYFLDGIRVPYIFHVGAGPSVIHPALMDRVDLYPGGYPAQFGRYSGGVVAGETTEPPTEAHGEGNIRLFDAGGLLDVPFDDGRGELLAGGRYAYTGFLLSLLSPGTLLDYWDYQFRAGYDLTAHDRLGVFAFGAYDYLGQKTPTSTQTLFGAEFHRVDVRYDHRLGDDAILRLAVTGGVDLTEPGTEIPIGDSDIKVRDRLLGARSELTYRLSPRALLRAGADLQVDSYDVQLGSNDLGPSAAAIVGQFPSRTDRTFGTRADVVLQVMPGLEVTPGVRVDYFESQGAGAVGVDPRLAGRTAITRRLELLTAIGIAHQPPAFAIPVPGFQPGGLKGGLQTAVQESAGLALDLGQGTLATATLFHNAFSNLSDALSVSTPWHSGCPAGSFPSTAVGGDHGSQPGGNPSCGDAFVPGTLGPDRSGGGGQAADSSTSVQTAQAMAVRANGNAYGLELLLKRNLTSHLGGFLSYTLSRSTRTAGGRSFIATFDRTHVLNAAASYDLGKGWRAGARVTFYTGLPRAPTPDSTATRLDPFFRLDVRVEKRWQLSRRWWVSAVAECMNATLSTESIATTCTLDGCQDRKVGPLTLPSLGVEGGF
jgi:hypothetical protein